MDSIYIEKLLKESFLNDFISIYNVALGILGESPEQANTEVKSALVHLARAVNENDDIKAKDQIKQASDHLVRGKRDCYKLVIAKLIDEISQRVNTIEECYGKAPASLISSIREKEYKRRELYSAESRGEHVSDRFEELAMELIRMNENLFADHGDPFNRRCILKRCYKKIRPYIKRFTILLFVGAITTFIIKVIVVV